MNYEPNDNVLSILNLLLVSCYFDLLLLFHHGTMFLQVADREGDLQISKIATNILNKQLWRANKG
jgi:hypothetical protein